jgi:penicillin-binding protein activator
VVNLEDGSCEVTVKVFDRTDPVVLSTRFTEWNREKMIETVRQIAAEAAARLRNSAFGRHGQAYADQPSGPQNQPARPEGVREAATTDRGHLKVEGAPRGARVQFLDLSDNQAAQPCTIPCRPVSLPPGAYTVKLSAAGYESIEPQARVQANRTMTLRVSMKRLGAIKVAGSPRGARVEVSGPNGFLKQGSLPWQAEGLIGGAYRVKVSQRGYASQEKTLRVSTGRAAKWTNVRLVRASSGRRVSRQQAQANGNAGNQGRNVRRVSADPGTDLRGRWNDTDTAVITRKIVDGSLADRWVSNFRRDHNGAKPVLVVGPIKNRSSEHIDTNRFAQMLEKSFLQSGNKIRFVPMDSRQRSAGAGAGMEMGANFMMIGQINMIHDRHNGQTTKLYQVSLQLQDLQTNEIVWVGTQRIKKIIPD